jgi:hypothetical protein
MRKHRLRIELLIANNDLTKQIAPNVTLGDEHTENDAAFGRVRAKYAELLYSDENSPQPLPQ